MTLKVISSSIINFSSPTSNLLNHPMKFPTLTLGLAGLAALASLSTASASELCTPVQSAVTKAIVAAPESVLAVVAQQVAASPKCACEIVKAAISAVKTDNATVVAIVEAAAAAAPAPAGALAGPDYAIRAPPPELGSYSAAVAAPAQPAAAAGKKRQRGEEEKETAR